MKATTITHDRTSLITSIEFNDSSFTDDDGNVIDEVQIPTSWWNDGDMSFVTEEDMVTCAVNTDDLFKPKKNVSLPKSWLQDTTIN